MVPRGGQQPGIGEDSHRQQESRVAGAIALPGVLVISDIVLRELLVSSLKVVVGVVTVVVFVVISVVEISERNERGCR